VIAGIPGSAWSIFCTRRDCRSAAPPAPELTTISMFLSGFHGCAAAGAATARQIAAAQELLQLHMTFLLLVP
jgi:hypothetical protein